MDPDFCLPPFQTNLSNIKTREKCDNESYIENNFNGDDDHSQNSKHTLAIKTASNKKVIILNFFDNKLE